MRAGFLFPLLGALLLSHCTREPAPGSGGEKLSLDSLAFTADGRYLAGDSAPLLLIGIDAYGAKYTPQALIELVDRLEVNGGNYLRISAAYLDSAGVHSALQSAVSRGMVVDTGRLSPMVTVAGSVAGFNRELLSGNGRVAYKTFSQAALNGLRAVRTVERHLPFPSLEPADDLLGTDNPTGAEAASDGAGNYLIYIPAAGQVTVRLPDSTQRRRVTVVGHLGTQRSETLHPPYDRQLTLRSNEAKGGWMILERLTE